MARYNETRMNAENGNNRLLDLIFARFKVRIKKEIESTYKQALQTYDEKGFVTQDIYIDHRQRLEKLLYDVIFRSMKSGAERTMRTFINAGWLDKKQANDNAKNLRVEFGIQAQDMARIDAGLIAATTEKEITDLISKALEQKGFLGDKLSDLLKRAEERSIFRTIVVGFSNVHQALNFGSGEAVKVSEDPEYDYFKIWVTQKDERVRAIYKGAKFDHLAMEGVKVLTSEKFTVPGGAVADGPGDRNTPIGNWINCRCFLRYNRERK